MTAFLIGRYPIIRRLLTNQEKIPTIYVVGILVYYAIETLEVLIFPFAIAI